MPAPGRATGGGAVGGGAASYDVVGVVACCGVDGGGGVESMIPSSSSAAAEASLATAPSVVPAPTGLSVFTPVMPTQHDGGGEASPLQHQPEPARTSPSQQNLDVIGAVHDICIANV